MSKTYRMTLGPVELETAGPKAHELLEQTQKQMKMIPNMYANMRAWGAARSPSPREGGATSLGVRAGSARSTSQREGPASARSGAFGP